MSNKQKNDREVLEEMFPAVLPIKVITLNETSEEISIIRLNNVLDGMEISYESWTTKLSKTGKYTVFTAKLKIEHLEQLHDVFKNLGEIENVVKVI